jgi:hypothetical protein
LYLPANLTWAEIGCYDGASAELWMLKCSKLYCIDTWDWTLEFHPVPPAEVEQRFDNRLQPYSDRLVKIKGASELVYNQIPDRSLDGIYIDGNHTYEYCKRDIELYIPKLKDSAIITGHDYGNTATPDVKVAIDEIFGEPDIVFMDSSWAYRFVRKQ